MVRTIAIYDIGKTNKKLILYDTSYRIIRELQTNLPEEVDDDGFPCEDLDGLIGWMRQTWSKITGWNDVRVDALHCTTYGASLVHLDENRNPVTSLYSYFKPIAETLPESLYERYGGRVQFTVETASPAMGMLNSGLQLYWLKMTKPDIYNRIKTSLHLPDFCSYVFTGILRSELTSIGCHTALWNFSEKKYHEWVYDEKIDSLLAPIGTEVFSGTIELDGRTIPVGTGFHDSSAALVPYLHSFDRPFILLSTGTWCVNLNPFAQQPLTATHLERDCLSYLTFQGTAVKASRLYLGGEHDHQAERLAEHYTVPGETYKNVKFDLTIAEKLLTDSSETDRGLKPATMKGTGPIPDKQPDHWNLSLFTSYKEAYHQLLIDLVCIVGVSIYLINERRDDIDLFVDGGFGKNEVFMNLLATLFPSARVRSSHIAQATALGAALVMHPFWDGNESVEMEMFNLKEYRASRSDLVVSYYNRRYRRAGITT
jgi:L-fuculokinase